MDKWTLELFFFVGGIALAGFQWLIKNWVRTLEENLKHLQEDQRDIDKEVKEIKENFVHKTDLREIKDELIVRLIRIESYLMDKKNV